MDPQPPRSRQQRQQDTRTRMEQDIDAWVATAEAVRGTPYLVPLSFLWDGHTLLLATPAASPTGRNLQTAGQVRLGLGPTRDVVLIEGTVETLAPEALPEGVGTPSRRRPASTRASARPPTSTSASTRSASRRGAKPTSWRGAS